MPPRGALAPPAPAGRPIDPRPSPLDASPTAPARPIRLFSAGGTLKFVWAIGFLAVLAPTVAALARSGRLGGSSRVGDPAWLDLVAALRGELGIGRRVELRLGAGGAVPLTWGVFRPVVLLPGEAEGWPPSTRRLVLLHELAHVARRDVAALLLGRVAAAVYWFHPLAWLALARLRAECEHAADDAVLAAGVRPSAYAGQLLVLARSSRAPRPPLALAMARPHTLEQRMVALFDESRSHAALPARAARRLGLAALALIALLGTVHPGPAAARPGPAPSAPAAPPTLDPPPSPAQAPPAEGPGRIEGTVVRDADGQAAGGATVIVLDPPAPGEDNYYGQLPLRQVRADGAGRFVVAGLPPGKYRVWANAGPLTSRDRAMVGRGVTVPGAGAAPAPVELRLKPGRTLAVRVHDAATGRPIAGASVGFVMGDIPEAFRTDAAGAVVVAPLTAQVWAIEARAEGYARVRQDLDLAAPGLEDADFRLGPGGTIAGVVRDPAGRPIAGVGVSVTDPNTYRQAEYTETGPDGSYRLANVRADTPLRFLVRHSEYVQVEQPIVLERGTRTIAVTLEPRPDGGSVGGIVRDGAGRPVAGAAVSNVGGHSSDVRETTTGPDGRYVLRNLFSTPGYGKEIFVRAPGLAPRRLQVEVGPPDRPGTADVTLEPGHQLAGRAVDAAGRPQAGVIVFLENRAIRRGTERMRRTGADGVFRFDSLPDPATSPTRIDLLKAGFSDARNREATLDTDRPADYTLTAEGVVAGRVVDASTGRPIPDFRVRRTFSSVRSNPPNSWLAGSNEEDFPFRSPEGRFELRREVAGMVLQVTVVAAGYENAAVDPVEVLKAGEPGTTEFALQPIDPGTLIRYAGRLRDGAGLPISGVEVRLVARRSGADRDRIPSWDVIRDGQYINSPGVLRFLRATTDAQGRFDFAGVPRDATAELFWWGGAVAPARREGLERLDAAARAALDIEAAAPARLAVRVDRGKYPTAALIQVGTREGLLAYTSKPVPDDGAEVEITELPAGDCSVRLTPAYQVDPKTPNGLLTPPDLATASVRLVPGATRRVDFGKSE